MIAGVPSVGEVEQLRIRAELSRKEARRTAVASLAPTVVYAAALWWAWLGLRSSPEYKWVWFVGFAVAVLVTLAGFVATAAAQREVRTDLHALRHAEQAIEEASEREWATGAIAVLGERDSD